MIHTVWIIFVELDFKCVYRESLNAYIESLNAYIECLNAYIESLNAYIDFKCVYRESLKSAFALQLGWYINRKCKFSSQKADNVPEIEFLECNFV